MASNTENLNLLMKNPSTDGADTFNVQTMLNENWQKIDNNAGSVAQTLANILKPTTPPIIGLPPSTTPDGMFQALGNTGELHVWRKTVIYNQPVPEVPGSYTLGAARQYTAGRRNTSTSASSYISKLSVSNEISVDLDGNVTLVNPTTVLLRVTRPASFESDSARTALGGYCYFMATDDTIGEACDMYLPRGQIFYVAENAVYTYAIKEYDSVSSFDAAQLVTGVPGTPAIPAGTTTTYPVSTNPNAYQEGDDAKAAWYVVGEIVTGKFAVSFYNAAEGYYYKVSESLDVSSSGSVSMPSTSENVLIDYSHNNNTTAVKNKFAGKFVQFLYRNGGDGRKFPDTKPPFNGYDIVYIPDNVSVTQEKVISDNDFVVDRYQPVTGYAAIPAGTTIEYLGKLGDKARVQVVSYVGTGTYGESNPNSLTFDFVPKLLLIKNDAKSAYHICLTLFGTMLTGTYEKHSFFDASGNMNYPNESYARKNGKNIQWYSIRNEYVQANGSGLKYTAIAIG